MNAEQLPAKLIDEILVQMDWEKIRKAMVSCDWRWWNTGDAPPSIDHLKECARYLLNAAWSVGIKCDDDDLPYYCATGGLVATFSRVANEVRLTLQFVLAEWSAEHQLINTQARQPSELIERNLGDL